MDELCPCDVCTQVGQPFLSQTLRGSCRSQSLQMDHLRPSLGDFPHESSHWDDSFPRETLQALQTDSNPHTFAIVPQFHATTPTPPKTTETKPRLGRDEVNILEREFKTSPKPTTRTKRQFAEDMGVDLARINVRKYDPYFKLISRLIICRTGSKTAERSANRRRKRRPMRLGYYPGTHVDNTQNRHHYLTLLSAMTESLSHPKQSTFQVGHYLQMPLLTLNILNRQVRASNPCTQQCRKHVQLQRAPPWPASRAHLRSSECQHFDSQGEVPRATIGHHPYPKLKMMTFT